MKTVVVGFSKAKSKYAIGSRLIRWYMKTPYSHVYVKLNSESLSRSLIYEAVGSGVRFIGESKWQEHAQEVDSFTITVSNDKYVKLLQYCVDNSGTDYGFMQNIGIVLASLFKEKFNRFTKGVNCSENSYNIAELLGITINKNKNIITPKDIYDRLSTL